MNSVLLVTAVGATTAGVGVVVGAAAPTDWGGVAQAITALGVLIVSVGTVITSIIQARQKKDVEETKVIMQETKDAVDGGMTKLLAAKVAEATAQATLDEQAAQRTLKGVEDAATLKERDRAAATPAASAPAGPLGVVPVEVVNAGDTSLKVTTEDGKK